MKTRLILLLLFITTMVSAQRFEVLAGNLKNLKDINKYNITFDYTNLKVYDFDTEEEYLAEKMEKRKDREGKAEKFKENWYADRVNKYEPSFITYFNERFPEGEIKMERNDKLKYTINVKTTWIFIQDIHWVR